jgi:hypothetical protein
LNCEKCRRTLLAPDGAYVFVHTTACELAPAQQPAAQLAVPRPQPDTPHVVQQHVLYTDGLPDELSSSGLTSCEDTVYSTGFERPNGSFSQRQRSTREAFVTSTGVPRWSLCSQYVAPAVGALAPLDASVACAIAIGRPSRYTYVRCSRGYSSAHVPYASRKLMNGDVPVSASGRYRKYVIRALHGDFLA